MAPPPPPPPHTGDHRFPCDQCGADLRFDAGADRLVCDFCGNTQALPELDGDLRELPYEPGQATRLPQDALENVSVSPCPNCGAQVQFTGADHATECPFCATPVVSHTGEMRHIKPQGVVPFALDEKAAKQAMTNWLGRLWFAPNGLQEYARKGRTMDGVYVPYWTFDADTASAYSGERGDVYYVSRTVRTNGKTRTVRERRVRWSPARGRVARAFDDVLVLASKSLPKKFTDALAPWTLTDLKPYAPEFLSGFRAEAYTVELDDGFIEARQIMDRIIAQDIRRDIGGDEQRIHEVDTRVWDETFKHILLPVWVAAYKFRGKTYRFVVNGQTGAVQGERPYSPWKIALAVVGAAVVAGAIAVAVQYAK